ncbi:MAG: ABC transporter substrate-binding protein [Mesorhizobium sp.]
MNKFNKALMAGIALAAMTLSGAQAQQKDTLTAALASEAQTMNPFKYAGATDLFYIGQMFEMLVRPDRDGKPVNWLAESWSIEGTPEKPVIDVQLRKGVTFHNGEPLTAADMEFSFKMQSDPKVSRLAQRLASVEKFEIVDDHHFKLHLSKPDGNLISAYLQIFAVPKKYYEEVGEEAFAQNPVGTGAWKFVSRNIKTDLKLEAYDGYWNKDHHPTVKNLVIKIIPEDITRVAAYESGEVDWIDNVPVTLVEKFKSMPGTQTVSLPGGNHLFIDFPAYQAGSPWSKLEVRQAIAHGFDMDAIIKSVLNGQGVRYAGIGTDSLAYDPSWPLYNYDPVKAKDLLAKAGFPNGFDTPCYNLTTQREANIKEVGEAIYAYLGTIGIRCQVVGLEYGAWVDKLRRATGEMDGILSTMSTQGIPADPGNAWTLSLHTYSKDTGYGVYSQTSDPEADKMVQELQRVMKIEDRIALIQKLGKYKYDNLLAGIPTYQPILTFAWRDNVKFEPWPYPGYWRNFQEIGFK